MQNRRRQLFSEINIPCVWCAWTAKPRVHLCQPLSSRSSLNGGGLLADQKKNRIINIMLPFPLKKRNKLHQNLNLQILFQSSITNWCVLQSLPNQNVTLFFTKTKKKTYPKWKSPSSGPGWLAMSWLGKRKQNQQHEKQKKKDQTSPVKNGDGKDPLTRYPQSLDFCHFIADSYVKYAGSRGWRANQSGTMSIRLCAFSFVLKHWQGCQKLVSGCAQWGNLPEEHLELIFLSPHTKRSQKDRLIPNVRCRFISPHDEPKGIIS